LNYIQIGKIVATHGIEGNVVVSHKLKKKTNLKNIEALFVEETKGSYIPYFVEKAKATTQEEIVCKLEGVNSKEAALHFVKKNVWLTENDFSKNAARSSPVALLGYLVIDNGKALSKVEEVLEQPQQLLLRIVLNGKDVYIPLHEKTLNRIDKRKSEIHVILPEGLLDVYLTN
jgi:16S rRNA processing protein RimM